MQHNHQRKKVWISLFWAFGILSISTVAAVWITGYGYIFKTLIYTYPGIDDLEIFHSRVIEDQNRRMLPKSVQYNTKELPEDVLKTMSSLETVAFVVLKDDSLIYEKYFGTHDENSTSNSFSVAKSIVSILTGIAEKEGLLSIEDPAGKFIPQFNEGMNASLRIHHLLTMSSGLDWDESYNSLFSPTTEAYYGSDLEHQVVNLKVVEEPGRRFNYQSCNTALLGVILTKATGKSLSEYAEEKLWKPIGATHAAYWSLDHNEGLEKAYCCYYATAKDFIKVGKLYLDSGMAGGSRLISKEFFEASVKPADYIDATGQQVDYYGYHWWLTKHDGKPVYYARGILGQYIIVVPEKRMVIVRLGHERGEKQGNHYDDMMAYLDGALKSF